ncbi:MAG: hypothetical protein Q4D85_09485 [Corynebacterium sp.]|nr:hypothetical protein [Corynebacterium sp.]MDO5098981.1 hypothetical protein [Corynebacterium sp.]
MSDIAEARHPNPPQKLATITHPGSRETRRCAQQKPPAWTHPTTDGNQS